jgi:hypothetical protein
VPKAADPLTENVMDGLTELDTDSLVVIVWVFVVTAVLVMVDVTLMLDEPIPEPDIVGELLLVFEEAADLENVGVPELVFD